MNNTLKIIKILKNNQVNSNVCKVINNIDSNIYALKTIRFNNNIKFKRYLQFIEELYKLNNKYILNIIFSWYSGIDEFNLFENDKNNYKYVYLLMDYCCPIEEYINERNLKFFKVNKVNNINILEKEEILNSLKIIIEVYKGINYLKKNNFSNYKKLSPKNIFLKIKDKNFTVKLGNFDFEDNNFKNNIIDEIFDKGIYENKNFNDGSYYRSNESYYGSDRTITSTTFSPDKMIKLKKTNSNNISDKKCKNSFLKNNFDTLIFTDNIEEKNETKNYFFNFKEECIDDINLNLFSFTFFKLIYPFKTDYKKIEFIKNLKSNKIEDHLKNIYPNIVDFLCEIFSEKEFKIDLKNMKNIFKKDIFKNLFGYNIFEDNLKANFKFEYQNKFKEYFLEIHLNKICLIKNFEKKNEILKKIIRIIYIKDYKLNLELNHIAFNSTNKKVENFKIELKNPQLLKNLFNFYNKNN